VTFQPEGCRQQDSCIHPTDSLRQKRCRIARRRRPDRATSRPGDAQGEDRWVERGGGFGHQLRRYPLTVRWPFGLSLSGCRSEIIAASLPASVTLAARLIRERVGSPAASHEGHRDAVTGAARRRRFQPIGAAAEPAKPGVKGAPSSRAQGKRSRGTSGTHVLLDRHALPPGPNPGVAIQCGFCPLKHPTEPCLAVTPIGAAAERGRHRFGFPWNSLVFPWNCLGFPLDSL